MSRWLIVLYSLVHSLVHSDFSDGSQFYPICGLVSLLRLGHQYKFEGIFEIALKVMKELFPCRLENWDFSLQPPTQWVRDSETYPYGWQFEVVNVALEVPGLKSILPSVYALCLQDLGLVSVFKQNLPHLLIFLRLLCALKGNNIQWYQAL